MKYVQHVANDSVYVDYICKATVRKLNRKNVA
jgi:hypothetical protein